MKRLSFVCLLLGLLAVLAGPAWSATSAAPAPKAEPASAPADNSPVAAISKTVAVVTGVADLAASRHGRGVARADASRGQVATLAG